MALRIAYVSNRAVYLLGAKECDEQKKKRYMCVCVCNLQRASRPSPPGDDEPLGVSPERGPVLDDMVVGELGKRGDVEQVVEQLEPGRGLFLANVSA